MSAPSRRPEIRRRRTRKEKIAILRKRYAAAATDADRNRVAAKLQRLGLNSPGHPLLKNGSVNEIYEFTARGIMSRSSRSGELARGLPATLSYTLSSCRAELSHENFVACSYPRCLSFSRSA